MIVTRIQLYCDSKDCANFFPREGPVHGAIYTGHELRKEAKKKGWTRRPSGELKFMTDICPTCTEAAKHGV